MLSGRPSQPQPPYRHDPLRLATAAVLLDIAHADGEFSPSEDGDITGYLTRLFQLSGEDTRELLEAADEIRKKTIDHFALTNYIRQNMTAEQRLDIVKTMWRTALSDGKLTEHEGHLIKKMGELMGIERHVIIDAKSAVLDERGR